MASKDLFDRETTNFARLSRLIIYVCRDLLISVLKAKLPPPGLTAILQSQKFQLFRILERRQLNILYPSGEAFSGTLEDLDFTILYKLLRNLQSINIPPPQNGWGKTPDTADRSLSANIDRLRVHRNEAYGNLITASLSDSEFNSRWSQIRQSMFEIEKDALIGDTYVTAVDALLTIDIDPDAEKRYIQEVLMKTKRAESEVKGADAATVNQDISEALQQKIKMCHSEMVIALADFIFPAARCWPAFKQLLSTYLYPADLEKENLYYYVDTLLHLECIDFGRYRRLYDVVHKIHKQASRIIKKAESDIEAMKNGGRPEETAFQVEGNWKCDFEKDIPESCTSQIKEQLPEMKDRITGIGGSVPKNFTDVHEKESNYKKIMEKKMETQTIKLTFIGHARAGKTCLMRQLLRKRIKPGGPDCTNLAELLTKRVRYTLGTSAKEKEKIEKGKEAELCRRRLRRLRKRPEDTEMTLRYQRNDLFNADSNADIEHHLNDDEEYSNHSKEESSPVVHKRKTLQMTEDQRKSIEDINMDDDIIDDSSVAYVTLFDFGGDEVFRNYHHCIMSANSIYLLVFDVSLWEDPDNQDHIVDEIEYWLNSVATYAKDISDHREGIPPIILIGSHMDKVTTDENDICDTIWDRLQEKPGIKDIYNDHVQQIICIADMHKSGLNEEKYLEVWSEIEKCAHLQSCWQDNIAGCWLALEEKLMLEKEKGIKFLNIQQILDINSELLVPLEDNELVPFLRYMHNAASIICFNIFGKTDSEFLTEQDKQITVILDINWIIKAFGAIITDDKFVKFPGHKQRHVWKNYKRTAMLTKEVLALQWSNITDEDRAVLISHMKDLGLITEQIPQEYIVPCLLGEAESDCIQHILNNESVHFTKTLCLVFHYQFVPQVIWDKTVAFCLHEFGECTYQERGNEIHPKRGFICRNVDDIWNFVLHCKGAMLKMTMFNHQEQPVPRGVGENLRLKIEGIIKTVLSMANQEQRKFYYYLHCDFWIHDGESYLGKPKIETVMSYPKLPVKDSEGNKYYLTPNDYHAWFGDVSKVPATEKFTDMTKVKQIHIKMVRKLSTWICPGLKGRWENFIAELDPHLTEEELYGVPDNNMLKICTCLMKKGVIRYGEYGILREIVFSIHVSAAEIIDDAMVELNVLRVSTQ